MSIDYSSLLLPLAILLAFAVAVVVAARRRVPSAWAGAVLVGVVMVALLVAVAIVRTSPDLPPDVRTRMLALTAVLYGLPVAVGTLVAIALARARPRAGWHLAAVMAAALLAVPVALTAIRPFELINAVQ